MLKKFDLHIKKNDLFTKQNTLLLAISGGLDSVALAHILYSAGFKFSLAHCNFKLRGKESDADEAFCKKLAKKLNLTIFVKDFDVKAYCIKNKISTQMAARNLRYEWFKEILKTHKIDYLVTAHHAGDVAETILLNLLRGTGINGLKGISNKNGSIIRPLLPFKKEELLAFVKQNNLRYREDKSNLEDKYERNFIRLNVIPQLKKLNPELETTFTENSAHLKQEASIVNDYLTKREKEVCHKKNGQILLNKLQLKQEKYKESLLHFILFPYGFNATQVQNIITNIVNQEQIGKRFITKEYELTIDRKQIILKRKEKTKHKEIEINSLQDLLNHPDLSVSKLQKFHLPKKNELLVNQSRLVFPLIWRTKKTGDKFRPYGMKGFKLLSDFFKDKKLNVFEKENCMVLLNGNSDIIWICGYRSDDRYKVTESDKDILKITYAN